MRDRAEQDRAEQDPAGAPALGEPIWESLVPRVHTRAAAQPGAGVIFSVPGVRSVATQSAGTDTDVPNPPPPQLVEPRADRPVDAAPALRHARPAPEPAGRVPVRPARPDPARAGLADDVERTRLRPARAKVPEVPAGPSLPSVAVDLTDGRRIEIVGVALIGRRPSPRPDDGTVQLITVADPGRSVSKTHLAIGVDRAGVWIRDRDSTNGTVVTLVDGQQILCAAEQQVRVPVGASVAFGDYGLTVVNEPAPARLSAE